MAINQAFPNADTPLVNPDGTLNLVWFRFFAALWNRTGSAPGNDSASFHYPSSAGQAGQVLTSEGNSPTIWTTPATRLSQLTNDQGFITSQALIGLSTEASTATQIESNLATTIPPPDSAKGQVGQSTHSARADHAHPRETDPNYAGTVTAAEFSLGGPTWTAGTGAPTSRQPNASLYSRIDGATGSRLYVSNGTTWTAVAGV